MAKTIKFNLILDNNPVRDLDGLRDNFNIEDLLGAYRNGSLKRWLESRDLTREIAELEKITGDDLSAARELCRVFLPDCTEKDIKAAVYPLKLRQEEAEVRGMEKQMDVWQKAEKLQQYKEQLVADVGFLERQQKELEARQQEIGNLQRQEAKLQRKDAGSVELVRAYFDGYENLLQELEEKGDDYTAIKSVLAELFSNYAVLYRIDAVNFYQRFISEHPLVILAMLVNPDMHPFIKRQEKGILNDVIAALETRLEENKSISPVKIFYTGSSRDWIKVEPAGKQFLIIRMADTTSVRNAGRDGEKLKSEAVNGKFPILDGIDSKNPAVPHRLIYMEV